MDKDQIISSFKADFAELLAKYDAQMYLQEELCDNSVYPSSIVFTIRTSEIETEDVHMYLWCNEEDV